MEKRLKDYLRNVEEIFAGNYDNMDDLQKQNLKEDMLIQIGFFQHERLIHLIVTVVFAILTLLTLFACLIVEIVATYILFLLLLILLIPYIRHYYILENGVQKLYTYYDKL